jgi:hypothetical protein
MTTQEINEIAELAAQKAIEKLFNRLNETTYVSQSEFIRRANKVGYKKLQTLIRKGEIHPNKSKQIPYSEMMRYL